MSEFDDEHQRAEEGVLLRDFISMAPESVALRAMIDTIGSVVVVENSSSIDEKHEIIETRE